MACKCTQTTVNATAGGSTTAALSACTYPLWISMLSGCTAGLPATNTQSDVLISNPSANIVFNTGYPEGCNDSYTTCNQYVNNIGINETRPQHTLSIGGTLDVRDYIHFSRGDTASLTGGSKESVYLGYKAGATRLTNVNSLSNTAVGYKSLGGTGVLNAAEGNVSVGYGSLENITTGDFNIAVGHQAGSELTAGIGNTLLGYRGGYGIGLGDYNVYLGYGQTNTDSVESNILRIGNKDYSPAGINKPLLYGNFATSGLTVNGSLELEGTLTGFGDNNTGGNEYVQVVGGVRTSGTIQSPNLQFSNPSFSTYVGTLTESGDTADVWNTAVGYQALGNIDTGGVSQMNTAIGYRAGFGFGTSVGTNSASNVAVGSSTLTLCWGCDQNVAVGDSSMISASSGSDYNVAVGFGP